MLTSPVTDEGEYYGPRVFVDGFVAAGSAGAAVGSIDTPPLTGYLDTIIFDQTDASDSFDFTISRPDFANETVLTKTGITSGGIFRPAAIEHKSEDGAALTSRRRIWLQNEVLTVAVANANANAFTFVILTLPN
jgi:hypothetical protein